MQRNEDMTANKNSLTTEEANLIVAQCVGGSNYKLLNIKETSIANETGGFMGDYIKIDITVRLANGSEKVFKFFSKIIPRAEGIHRDFVLEVQCYEKEVGFYTKILPLLCKFDSSKNDKTISGRWSPNCFYTRNDIIVMEDLTVAGFKVLNSRDLLNWNLCVSVMKTMASFHAASIIYEEKEKMITGKLNNISNSFPDLFTNVINRSMPSEEEKGWFAAGKRALVALVPYLTKYKHSKKLQKIIQDELPVACDSTRKLEKSDEFRNVVCHGDLWSANILFRYGSDGRTVKSRFVDFQLIKYAPPATDIVVFLYTTTSRRFRERHLDALLGVYYDEFSAELQSQGLSADELLSKGELQRSFNFYSNSGRGIAVLYFQLLNMETEQKQKLFSSAETFGRFFMVNREKEVRDNFLKDELYRTRMEEAMEELIEKDILNDLK